MGHAEVIDTDTSGHGLSNVVVHAKRLLNMLSAPPILADVSAAIFELKNSMSVVAQGEGSSVAILNRNEPVLYAIPARAYG